LEKRAASLQGPPFSNRGSANDPPKGGTMIIFVTVKLKKLFKKKRNYSWPRPESCPNCNDYKVWGHGYANAIFDGYEEPLLLKLYRCHVCGWLIESIRSFYDTGSCPCDSQYLICIYLRFLYTPPESVIFKASFP
jgi:hypothetical protein